MRTEIRGETRSLWHEVPSKANGHQARALRLAIEREEIQPYYQPIVDLGSQQIIGFEALARWISPHGLGMGPGEFIPLAASAGLLNLLTQSLLKTACRDAAYWPSELSLAVNVAPSQFPDQTFPDMIEASARSENFPLSRLVLEITEDVLRGSTDRATARTIELREMGVRLAMDDFGVGDSNIQRLGLVEFDIVKIDRCVTGSITAEKRTHRGLIAAIAVAKSLGLQVIAEGVEEEWQAGIIEGLGCSTIQGWLTGRPMPASEVASFIASNDQRRLLDCSTESALHALPRKACASASDAHAALMAGSR